MCAVRISRVRSVNDCTSLQDESLNWPCYPRVMLFFNTVSIWQNLSDFLKKLGLIVSKAQSAIVPISHTSTTKMSSWNMSKMLNYTNKCFPFYDKSRVYFEMSTNAMRGVLILRYKWAQNVSYLCEFYIYKYNLPSIILLTAKEKSMFVKI